MGGLAAERESCLTRRLQQCGEERPAVRVRAVKMYLESLATTQVSGAPKRMKSPGKAYWTELLKRARQQAASDSPEW